MACQSTSYYAKNAIKNGFVSVDGIWGYKLNGSECQDAFINQPNDQVVYVFRITKSRSKVIGNFNDVSSNMESEEYATLFLKFVSLNSQAMCMIKIN